MTWGRDGLYYRAVNLLPPNKTECAWGMLIRLPPTLPPHSRSASPTARLAMLASTRVALRPAQRLSVGKRAAIVRPMASMIKITDGVEFDVIAREW